MKCVRMRCREPLCARSFSAPGQSGMSSAWYRAPGKSHHDLTEQSPTSSRHVNSQMTMKLIFFTIYRFKFCWCCVGFHIEVLHPSGSAFIDSNKVYRLPLQLKTKTKNTEGFIKSMCKTVKVLSDRHPHLLQATCV